MEAFYLEIKEHLKKQLEANWSETSKFMRECAERLLGVTSGKMMMERENWWWNDEAQEAITWNRSLRLNLPGGRWGQSLGEAGPHQDFYKKSTDKTLHCYQISLLLTQNNELKKWKNE